MEKKEIKKCECTTKGVFKQEMAHIYDSEKELPYVNHKPGECKCTNELTQYHKNDKKVWLCSNCVMGESPII